MRGNKGDQKKIDHYEESNALLGDLILNYRTVISFGEQNVDQIMQQYEDLLNQPMKKKIKLAHLTGVAFGYSVAMRFIMIGSLFYIGSKLIIEYGLEAKGVYAA